MIENNEIDWEDKSGLIAFDEWEKRWEKRNVVLENLLKLQKYHTPAMCRVGKLLLDKAIKNYEENYDKYKEHMISNCNKCFISIVSKTGVEIEIIKKTEELNTTPLKFLKLWKDKQWIENNWKNNVLYNLITNYIDDLPKEVPQKLFPKKVPDNINFIYATWTYVCINCFKRFYHYALSSPSPINIKLMNCCSEPTIRFEKRTFIFEPYNTKNTK